MDYYTLSIGILQVEALFASNSKYQTRKQRWVPPNRKNAGMDGLVSMKEISFHAQGCTAALGVTFVSRKNGGPGGGFGSHAIHYYHAKGVASGTAFS
jgi:hypothetical protein